MASDLEDEPRRQEVQVGRDGYVAGRDITVIQYPPGAHGVDGVVSPQRVSSAKQSAASGPDGQPKAVRVRDARPRDLGVHAAIKVSGTATDMPVYVPRDIDPALRAGLELRGDHGCFILLVGGSSAGKTRTMYEALVAALPDWWLVHPESAGQVRALASAPSPRTVVWLDELQRYLNDEKGLTAGTVRILTSAGMVLVGTLWPDEYSARIAARQAAGTGDPRRRDAELLDLAEVFDLGEALTDAEVQRARELATSDGRLLVALADEGTGLTQILAAGPELIRRWTQAPTPYSRALITVAVDARRLGVSAPLTGAQLGAAIPGYLTPAQRASAPREWLSDAIEYATTPLHGAAAAVEPVGVTMAHTSGYTVADYLFQHAMRERTAIYPPPDFWRAMIDYGRTGSDLRKLAEAAGYRGRLRQALLLYSHALIAGDYCAGWNLGNLYVSLGNPEAAAEHYLQAGEAGVLDALIGYAHLLWDDGDRSGAERYCRRAADQGYLYGLRSLAVMYRNAGDDTAYRTLLREAGARGDATSFGDLADSYREAQDFAEAEKLYRAGGEAGDANALRHLAWMFQEQGRINEAEELYRKVAAAGLPSALRDLALMHEGNGEHEAAELTAREAVAAGCISAVRDLAGARADADGIRDAERILAKAVADGDNFALLDLAGLRKQVGDKDSAIRLTTQAMNNGISSAIGSLARLREEEGNLDEALRLYQQAANSGDMSSWRDVVRLRTGADRSAIKFGLTEEGDIQEHF